MPTSPYYPLALGNLWTYKMSDGRAYTSKVTSADGDTYTVTTTLVNSTARIKIVGDEYQTDGIEPGKWLATFKGNLKNGDTWQIEYTVNGVTTVLHYTVEGTGLSRDVEGASYKDVLHIQAESKMSMNGRPIPMEYRTDYFYARGTGLILTTSSAGDSHALTACEIK